MSKPKLTRSEKIARTIRKRQRAGLPWGRPRIYSKQRAATPAERQRAFRKRHHPHDLIGKTFGTLRVTRRYGTDHEGRATWFCDCLVELGGCGRKDYAITGKRLTRKPESDSPTVPSCGCLQWKRRHKGNTREAQAGKPHDWTPEGKAAIRASRVQLLEAGRLMRKRDVQGRFAITPKGSRTRGHKEGRPRKFIGTLKERKAAAARALRSRRRAP